MISSLNFKFLVLLDLGAALSKTSELGPLKSLQALK
jgi:hypothetical protein